MRPNVLNPLFASLSTLPGIGPKLEKLYARLVGRDGEPPRLIDLLFHMPVGFVDRRNQPKLNEVVPDTVVTVAVTIGRHRPPPPNRPRVPYSIEASDDTSTLTITYFKARADYLQKLLPEGELRYVSGTATRYDGHLQMVHPDRVVDAAGFAKLPLLDPVYPLTEGVHPNQVRRAIELALERLPALPEWQDEAWLSRNAYPSFAAALRRLHHPEAPEDVDPQIPPGRGSPMTSFWQASSRWRSCAHICERAPAAAAPPRADCARGSPPRCPTRSRRRRNAPSPISAPIWRSRSACCASCTVTSDRARRLSR